MTSVQVAVTATIEGGPALPVLRGPSSDLRFFSCRYSCRKSCPHSQTQCASSMARQQTLPSLHATCMRAHQFIRKYVSHLPETCNTRNSIQDLVLSSEQAPTWQRQSTLTFDWTVRLARHRPNERTGLDDATGPEHGSTSCSNDQGVLIFQHNRYSLFLELPVVAVSKRF